MNRPLAWIPKIIAVTLLLITTEIFLAIVAAVFFTTLPLNA